MIAGSALATPTQAPHGSGRLVDRFGRVHSYLRISITERCNLRCTYCMPAEGIALTPRENLLTSGEIIRLARLFAGLGVRKIRLTGGEPLVRAGVPELVAALRGIPGIEAVGLTTNGLLLRRHADALRRAGLSALNLSLDTLRPDRFARITRRDAFAQVWDGLQAALVAGFAPLKLNVVVIRDFNTDELLDFMELARAHPIQLRFIEFMPFAGNAWRAERVFTHAEMRAVLAPHYALRPDPAATDPHNTAREYRVEGFRGNVGFITSMTNDFCSGCNRLRLTADGKLKACLFDQHEVDLAGPLRAGGDTLLRERIERALAAKPAGHAALDQLPGQPNRSMIAIGG